MSNEEILRKAIKKANKNGYKAKNWVFKFKNFNDLLKSKTYFVLIFSHDFAKAFWGEKEIELPNPEWCDNLPTFDEDLDHDTLPAWQFHLQQLVLLSDNEKFKYIEKFL